MWTRYLGGRSGRGDGRRNTIPASAVGAVTFPVLIHRAAIAVYAGNIRNAIPKALWVLRQVSQLSWIRKIQEFSANVVHVVGVRGRLPPKSVDGLETCDVGGQPCSLGAG